jgi:hypothetical protein
MICVTSENKATGRRERLGQANKHMAVAQHPSNVAKDGESEVHIHTDGVLRFEKAWQSDTKG